LLRFSEAGPGIYIDRIKPALSPTEGFRMTKKTNFEIGSVALFSSVRLINPIPLFTRNDFLAKILSRPLSVLSLRL